MMMLTHNPFLLAVVVGAMLSLCVAASAQEPTGGPKHWPIVLGADDVPAFPPPPPGFDQERADVPHGKLEFVEYLSRTVGTTRKLLVYTPPNYSSDRQYNVLYLLHGIGGDETEWRHYCAPGPILDNLYDDRMLAPMIVVFPNGRAQKDDRAVGDIFKYQHAFEVFTGDLLNDIMPFIESRYPVRREAAHRALGGFSMGGGQSLNIAFSHPDQFDWIGAFSSAPNTRPPEQLAPEPGFVARYKLLYLSCGNQDGLLAVSQGVHRYLKSHDLPHVWTVNPGGHNGQTWKLDLYHFAPLLFK